MVGRGPVCRVDRRVGRVAAVRARLTGRAFEERFVFERAPEDARTRRTTCRGRQFRCHRSNGEALIFSVVVGRFDACFFGFGIRFEVGRPAVPSHGRQVCRAGYERFRFRFVAHGPARHLDAFGFVARAGRDRTTQVPGQRPAPDFRPGDRQRGRVGARGDRAGTDAARRGTAAVCGVAGFRRESRFAFPEHAFGVVEQRRGQRLRGARVADEGAKARGHGAPGAFEHLRDVDPALEEVGWHDGVPHAERSV